MNRSYSRKTVKQKQKGNVVMDRWGKEAEVVNVRRARRDGNEDYEKYDGYKGKCINLNEHLTTLIVLNTALLT